MLIPTFTSTTVLATITTDGADDIAVTVAHISTGFSVTLFDTDAGEAVGSVIYPDESRAFDAAVALSIAQAV